MVVLLALPGWAMPAVYATRPGESMVNHHSHIVVAPGSSQTTVTLWADVSGDGREYVIVVPVDPVAANSVRLYDPWAVRELDGFTAPRLLDWTCTDLSGLHHGVMAGQGCAMMVGCADGVPAGESSMVNFADDWLVMGERVTPATYEVGLVGPDSSAALASWLDERGFELPAASLAALDGKRVATVTVALVSEPTEPVWPNAIQVQVAPDLALDLAQGAHSSAGVQEVVVHTIGISSQQIVNYPEVDFASDCLARLQGEEGLDGWYARTVFDGTVDGGGRAHWVNEFAGRGICLHCTNWPGSLPTAVTRRLQPIIAWPQLSRFRLRYTPAQVDAPLELSNAHDDKVRTLVRHRSELESRYPVCGEGRVDEPGECPPSAARTPRGCGVVPGPSGLALLMGLAVLWRRRR